MKHRKINVAKEFTRFPSGRFKVEGAGSGEEFRDEYLIPALKENDKVTVDFEGVLGIPSSFLEEAFGGLRRCGITEFQLDHKLDVLDGDSFSLSTEITDYIKRSNGK